MTASSSKTYRGFCRSALVLTAVIALGLTAMPAKADHDCKATVAERLDRLNVDPSDFLKIDWVEEIRQKEIPIYVERIDAWVSLRSCEGHVVMEMTPHCYVRQI